MRKRRPAGSKQRRHKTLEAAFGAGAWSRVGYAQAGMWNGHSPALQCRCPGGGFTQCTTVPAPGTLFLLLHWVPMLPEGS